MPESSVALSASPVPEFRFFFGQPAKELPVASFWGEHAISEPFGYQIELGADPFDPGIPSLGSSARLEVGQAQTISGMVSSVEHLKGGEEPECSRLRVRLVPLLWRLGQGRQSRIFQDQSVPSIVQQILAQAGIACSWCGQARYAERPYCVQYQESDLEFVVRILAEEGIYYRTDPQGEIVLGDGPNGLGDHEPILFRPPSGLVPAQACIHEIERMQQVRPSTFVLRDFDEEHPALDLTAEHKCHGTDQQAEIYEHRNGGARAEQLAQWAQVRLEEARLREQVYTGSSHCPTMQPGQVFRLEGHASCDREYLIVRVRHVGDQRALWERLPSGRGSQYSNRFECIPADTPFRPSQRKRRTLATLDTATVVGPVGEEIHTDRLGRVKVEFHWDRQGKRDPGSSCWIRVAQNWAGAGWGSIALPRVGMEVAVAFLGGNPDRPVVFGCLYNGTHPPPYALPEHQSRTGLKTESTPCGGGANELWFEDAKGQEEVYLHAQKNLTEVVLHDQRVEVGADQVQSVAGRQVLTVGDSREKTVEKNEKLAVKGDVLCTVGGNARTSVGKGRVTEVAQEEHLSCKQREVVCTEGDRLEAKDQRIHLTGSCDLSADRKLRLKQGGTLFAFEGGQVELRADGFIKLRHAGGLVEIDAAGKVKVRGGPEAILESGECSVRLGQGAVHIAAPAGIRLQVGGSTLDVTAEGIRTSGTVLGAGAQCTNEIQGAIVKIN